MSEKRNSGGPSVGLLLLIPAVVVVAHMAKRHHRMMWDDVGGGPESAMPHRSHGQHRFAGRGFDPAAGAGFRLPPRIEWILDTWHTRAHQEDRSTDTTTA